MIVILYFCLISFKFGHNIFLSIKRSAKCKILRTASIELLFFITCSPCFSIFVFQLRQQFVNLTKTVYKGKPSAIGESVIVKAIWKLEMGKLRVNVSTKTFQQSDKFGLVSQQYRGKAVFIRRPNQSKVWAIKWGRCRWNAGVSSLRVSFNFW